jgi:hypothetical protein
MGANQSSSMETFDTLSKEFYSDSDRVYAVEEYEMAGKPMIMPDGSPVHGCLKDGDNKGIPIMDIIKYPSLSEGGTCILKEKGRLSGEMIIVFIPGNCKNGSITNNIQPYNYKISESGLSSLWHLLAITENVTYCNAVTLKKEQLNIVKDKKELLEKAMRILISGTKDDIGSYEWIKRLDGLVTMDDGSEIPINITEECLSEECSYNFKKFVEGDNIIEDVMQNIGYFYHPYTQSTVFTGHMHAFAIDYRTKCYDCMESKAQEKGFIKNIPVDEIIEYVNSDKLAILKLEAIKKFNRQPEPEPEPEPESDEDDALTRTKSHRY